MEKYKNKTEALKAIKAKGYTTHYYTGQSGDYATGSREYFYSPDSEFNEYKMPITKHATISKLRGGWVMSEFGNK